MGLILKHDWFPVPLPDNVTIGQRSWCYSAFAFVHCRSRRLSAVRIGNDTGVYAGSFFELGPHGEVQIGDFCTLVGAIISSNRRVLIEDYAFLAHEVVLADSMAMTPPESDAISDDVAINVPMSIIVGKNSWVGTRAVLLAGARIGEGAIVGAAAVVDFEVPSYSIVAGNPARIVGCVASPLKVDHKE